MYRQRAAASTGLALGSLSLPWLFAGLVARQRAAGQPATAAGANLHACLAASAAAALLILRDFGILWPSYGQSQRIQRDAAAAQKRSQQQRLPCWARWALTAALTAVALQALAAEAALGALPAASLAATAAAACACLQALLAGLPGTLTIGEALVAAQAAALLGSAAIQHVFSQPMRSQGGSSAAGPAGAAAPCQRFVLLLTAGSALVAAVLFPLLIARQPQAQGHGAAALQQGKSGSRQPPGLPAAVVAAVVAAVAAAAAAPATLWALRFALASHRRRLLMDWWAAALTAALPAMGWLSRSGRVPAILGELLCRRLAGGRRPGGEGGGGKGDSHVT